LEVIMGGVVSQIEPQERRWGLEEGDEIVPGLAALRRLGGGSHYEAYEAWDERLHAIVVVKLVRPHLVDDAHVLEDLAAEAAMLDRLAHPVIVRGYGAELEGPRPRLVLEHLEGPRLSTLIRREGPLAIEQLVPLALQLCSALHYLREERVVHLDVKPANTIMSAPPRLIDLSVAATFERAATLTSPVGTDGYMAPEQCDPRRLGPVGPAADVFGLGVTLYRAATGDRPFPHGDPDGVGPERWPQLGEAAQPPDPRRVPGAVSEPILACLEADPEARPAPAELAKELEAVLAMQSKPKLAALKPRWR
jgi:eukaryotic-like serine/threonine-protein kinase